VASPSNSVAAFAEPTQTSCEPIRKPAQPMAKRNASAVSHRQKQTRHPLAFRGMFAPCSHQTNGCSSFAILSNRSALSIRLAD